MPHVHDAPTVAAPDPNVRDTASDSYAVVGLGLGQD